ncbi:protein transport protein Sec24B-like isoform X2 [Castor canadensis]|uniref:Protein transport protein Sec24B-like isoform X2 n=1 Tax=Castor canadensis TaxID=51338 RepID=A0AC58L7V0_CASCN
MDSILISLLWVVFLGTQQVASVTIHLNHHQHNPVQVQKLQKELRRYLTPKIGFEAVRMVTKDTSSFSMMLIYQNRCKK